MTKKKTITVEGEFKRLSNLSQNKNKDRSVLEREAQISVWKKQVNIAQKFKAQKDKNIAEELFDNYISNYEFSNFSDINTLADLIFEEVLKQQLQNQINDLYADKTNNASTDKLIQSLHHVEDRVLQFKGKLGINTDKKQDDLTAFQQMLKRLNKYIPFHRNEFTTVCASCGEMLLLRRKCGEDFDCLKNPHFVGRFWYNKRGMEFVKRGIWTKEQYAWVFYTSPQYVTWSIENEDKIVKIDGIKQEEVEDFIDKNPFLKNVTVPSKLLTDEKDNDSIS